MTKQGTMVSLFQPSIIELVAVLFMVYSQGPVPYMQTKRGTYLKEWASVGYGKQVMGVVCNKEVLRKDKISEG